MVDVRGDVLRPPHGGRKVNIYFLECDETDGVKISFNFFHIKVAFHFHIFFFSFNDARFTVKESVIDLKIAHRIN